MNNHSILKKGLCLLILCTVAVLGSCASSGSGEAAGAPKSSSSITTIERSTIGTVGKYTYEFWNQNETGDAKMGLREDGSFEVSWSGIFNMLGRYGVRPGQGVKSVTYAVDNYAVSKGVSYLCVYGWTYDAGTDENLVEFYIVDNWKNFRPPGNNGTLKGTVSVDGSTYDIYTSIRKNQPSIKGTKTFTQYWSVRRNGAQRLSGTIDVAAHFDAWKKLGMGFGNTMYEVSFCVEGYGGNSGGSGSANVSKLSFK